MAPPGALSDPGLCRMRWITLRCVTLLFCVMLACGHNVSPHDDAERIACSQRSLFCTAQYGTQCCVHGPEGCLCVMHTCFCPEGVLLQHTGRFEDALCASRATLHTQYSLTVSETSVYCLGPADCGCQPLLQRRAPSQQQFCLRPEAVRQPSQV